MRMGRIICKVNIAGQRHDRVQLPAEVSAGVLFPTAQTGKSAPRDETLRACMSFLIFP
jgi:hypothetical protein